MSSLADVLAVLDRAKTEFSNEEAFKRARDDAIVRFATRDDTLSRQREESDKRKLQPWRAAQQMHQLEEEEIAKMTAANLQTLMEERSKAKQLPPEYVLILSYLLYGGDADRHFLAGMLLSKGSWDEVVRAHNFHAAGCDPSFLPLHGAVLEKFAWPLFPCTDKFRAQNLELLASAAVQGGDSPNSTFPSVYRPLAPLGRQVATRGGEAYLPVEISPDGKAARVDVQPAVDADRARQKEIRDLRAKTRQLENTISQLRASRPARGSTGGRGSGRGKRAFGGDGAASDEATE